ncbi:MAG: hypothetical protein ACHP65_07340 [Legionellales bacterium]
MAPQKKENKANEQVRRAITGASGDIGNDAEIANSAKINATILYGQYGIFGKMGVSLDMFVARNITGCPFTKPAEKMLQADILTGP